MRDCSSHAIRSLFGILAVNGILLVLPGAAHGASAPAPTGGSADFMPHVVADVAADLGCVLAETVAVVQDTPGEGGSECKNQDGSPRECTPSENLKQCAADAKDAVAQCHEESRYWPDHVFCEVGWAGDVLACMNEFRKEMGLPLPEGKK